jgi:hypothetical protein
VKGRLSIRHVPSGLTCAVRFRTETVQFSFRGCPKEARARSSAATVAVRIQRSRDFTDDSSGLFVRHTGIHDSWCCRFMVSILEGGGCCHP